LCEVANKTNKQRRKYIVLGGGNYLLYNGKKNKIHSTPSLNRSPHICKSGAGDSSGPTGQTAYPGSSGKCVCVLVCVTFISFCFC